MIDPTNITNYNLTDVGLEEHLLFWVTAAGKNGVTAAKCLDKLLKTISGPYGTPIESVFRVGNLFNFPQLMKECGIGCYTNKARTFREIAIEYLTGRLDLHSCSTDDLEKIYGIGRKTSRCFILHSRKDAQCAGLDTHMLKHLHAMGVENVPKQTPASKKQYERLEKEVLKLAKAAKIAPAEYDLMIWNKYSVSSAEKT